MTPEDVAAALDVLVLRVRRISPPLASNPNRFHATVGCAVMNRFTMPTRYLRNESAEIYFQMPIVLCASPHSSVQARGVPDDQ